MNFSTNEIPQTHCSFHCIEHLIQLLKFIESGCNNNYVVLFVFKEPSSSKQGMHSVSEKKVSLRAVRQFMRLGKSKHQTSRRDSSTEDENRYKTANIVHKINESVKTNYSINTLNVWSLSRFHRKFLSKFNELLNEYLL